MNSRIERIFPKLVTAGYRETSPATPEYNCIAWAVMKEDECWWPDAFGDYYWPPDVPRVETVEAFIEAYSLFGYTPCETADWELGSEKIALFVDSQGMPTHAARQLPSGKWTSKLGQLEDIEHDTLEGLTEGLYGKVGPILKRPIQEPEGQSASEQFIGKFHGGKGNLSQDTGEQFTEIVAEKHHK